MSLRPPSPPPATIIQNQTSTTHAHTHETTQQISNPLAADSIPSPSKYRAVIHPPKSSSPAPPGTSDDHEVDPLDSDSSTGSDEEDQQLSQPKLPKRPRAHRPPLLTPPQAALSPTSDPPSQSNLLSSPSPQPPSPTPSTAAAASVAIGPSSVTLQSSPSTGDKKAGKVKERKRTHLSDVVCWTQLSFQYALAYGVHPDGVNLEPIAIYDKTFRNPKWKTVGSWKEKVALGVLTKQGIHKKHLANAVKTAHKVHELLSYIFEDFVHPDLEVVLLSEDFFIRPTNGFYWKEGSIHTTEQESSNHVHFFDIDWLQMQGNISVREWFAYKLTNEQRQFIFESPSAAVAAAEACSSLFAPADDPCTKSPMWRFLSGLVFLKKYNRKHRTYHYELHLPRARPVKVIDIKYPDSSLETALVRAVSTNIVKGGLSAVPFFGPPQIVNMALERIFDFVDVLNLQHQAEALTLIIELRQGHPNSPFQHPDLTPQILERAIFYLLRSNIMLSSIIKNTIFAKKDELVPKYMEDIELKQTTSLQFLNSRTGKNKLDVIRIPATLFAFGVQRHPKTGDITKLKLYVLVFTKIGRKRKPHAAVDFIDAHRETKKRERLQQLLTASNLLYIPVSGVGGVARMAYKEVVIREVHKRQMWEHGLLCHMRHHPGEIAGVLESKIGINIAIARKYEAYAIKQLEERALSPLDLSHAEADVLRRNVERWMFDQYPPKDEWTPDMIIPIQSQLSRSPFGSETSVSVDPSSTRSPTIPEFSEASMSRRGPITPSAASASAASLLATDGTPATSAPVAPPAVDLSTQPMILPPDKTTWLPAHTHMPQHPHSPSTPSRPSRVQPPLGDNSDSDLEVSDSDDLDSDFDGDAVPQPAINQIK